MVRVECVATQEFLTYISMPLLTEVRQGKLGCSEGESPSRLMEELVFRTKEMNGKV